MFYCLYTALIEATRVTIEAVEKFQSYNNGNNNIFVRLKVYINGFYASLHLANYSQSCIKRPPKWFHRIRASYKKRPFYVIIDHLMYTNSLKNITKIDFGREI